MRTVVVRAGLGGLSAACHLAGRGHEVVVIDRESVPGDPTYRAWFPDGSELRVRPDREAMVEEFRAFAGGGEAAAFERFCTWLGRIYELELPHFIDRNYKSALDLARDPMALVRLVRLGGLLAPTVAGYFDDPRLQRISSFQSMYADPGWTRGSL